MNVSVLIVSRDGENLLPHTLKSLVNQTVGVHIVLVDDCSIDKTDEIIKYYLTNYSKNFSAIKYLKRERKDYNRVPVLINMAYKSAPKADYYMISANDNIYPNNYLEKLIKWMKIDGVELASGYNKTYNATSAPTGGGRVMTASLMKKLMPLPPDLTWDTWMLFKMQQLGLKYKVFPIKKTPIGKERTFIYTHGHGSHILGTPLVFTMGRVIKEFIKNKNLIQALSILIGQLEYTIRRIPKSDIAPYVNQFRKYLIKRKIMKTFGVA